MEPLSPRNPRLLTKTMRANHLTPTSENGFARGLLKTKFHRHLFHTAKRTEFCRAHPAGMVYNVDCYEFPCLCCASVCFDADIRGERKKASFQLPGLFISVPLVGRWCLMGHEGRAAILTIELPHGGVSLLLEHIPATRIASFRRAAQWIHRRLSVHRGCIWL